MHNEATDRLMLHVLSWGGGVGSEKRGAYVGITSNLRILC